MKEISITIIFLLQVVFCFSQPVIPSVTSYDRINYGAGRQNWDIAKDKNDIIYIANNQGLLVNINDTWELIPTENNDVIITLKVEDDIIWSGGNIEFGYYYKNDNGTLKYKRCGAVNGGQIWNIETTKELVYFRTEEQVIVYDKKTEKEIRVRTKGGFSSLKKWNNTIWATDNENHLGHIIENQFIAVDSLTENQKVRTLFTHKNELYILYTNGSIHSFNGGIFQKVIDLPEEIYKEGIFCIKSYNSENLLIGTISSGLFIYSLNKKKIIQHISSKDGLKDNTILTVFNDENGDIWCGLDYGVSKIELQREIKTIFNSGATYKILNVTRNNILLATNKGLYQSKNNEPFQIIPNSQGQVWNIKKLNNILYVCHDKGLFQLKNNQLIPLYTAVGVMDISMIETNYFLSTYSGLYLSKIQKGKLNIEEHLKHPGSPKLYHDQEHKCIWAKTNNGILHQYQYNSNHAFSVLQHPSVQRIFPQNNGELLFLVDGKVTSFNQGQFEAIKIPSFNNLIDHQMTALQIIDKGLTYAYISNEKLHMRINIVNGNFYDYSNLFKSLQNQFLKDHEFISFYEGELQIATERGVKTFDPNSKYRSIDLPEPVISKVIVSDKMNVSQKLMYPFIDKIIKLKKNENNIKFIFGVAKDKNDIVEYRTKLIPFDDQWSDWGITNEREYTLLSGGHYDYVVEAKINNSAPIVTSLPIEIQKTWYQTFWVTLPLIFALFLLYVIVMNAWKIMNQKAAVKQKKQQKIDLDKKTLEIKNEQLIKYAEELSRKNDFLRQLSDGLSIIKHKNAKLWIDRIDDEMNNDKKNFIFYKLFSELHHDFIVLLNEKYPQLTSHDHRLIALIRFNLNNNEIANIMNITNRSVIMNRYRLRKKMGLDKEVDLDKFIKDLK
ncbi:hypothetical protein [Flammeovirga sp. SJP92]|uniref:helix-turn-helix and ligand-binding sensor domain-containing protein n=1 Tax=Flammeovirga sp. SJP92 TaxID=1775430 RepID=UPI0007896DD6|nr:hypothetical protein [Flammeovirga sp. SJP92]KXX70510.1 hypothetical protein AVL50_08415 [Flammeovirga sp. SJP92]